jgi:hypothetical protein
VSDFFHVFGSQLDPAVVQALQRHEKQRLAAERQRRAEEARTGRRNKKAGRRRRPATTTQ